MSASRACGLGIMCGLSGDRQHCAIGLRDSGAGKERVSYATDHDTRLRAS
jgi:hypothetical protein